MVILENVCSPKKKTFYLSENVLRVISSRLQLAISDNACLFFEDHNGHRGTRNVNLKQAAIRRSFRIVLKNTSRMGSKVMRLLFASSSK